MEIRIEQRLFVLSVNREPLWIKIIQEGKSESLIPDKSIVITKSK